VFFKDDPRWTAFDGSRDSGRCCTGCIPTVTGEGCHRVDCAGAMRIRCIVTRLRAAGKRHVFAMTMQKRRWA